VRESVLPVSKSHPVPVHTIQNSLQQITPSDDVASDRLSQISVIQSTCQPALDICDQAQSKTELPSSFGISMASPLEHLQSVNHQSKPASFDLLRQVDCPVGNCTAVYKGEFGLSLLIHHLAGAHCNRRKIHFGTWPKNLKTDATWFERYRYHPAGVDWNIRELLIGLMNKVKEFRQCPFCFRLESRIKIARKVSALRY
jgi:hypothetical protein